MLQKKENSVYEFIQSKATNVDPCKNIQLYSDEVKVMLQHLYDALWRFNLYDSQIIYIMNEAIKGFRKK